MSIHNPLTKINLGSPGEDISKKDLHSVCQRFKNLTRHQISRIQSFLLPRQQTFLKLLPLLFHQNAPLLPGFVNKDTPAGIPDYSPTKTTLKEAKYFSKNYSFTKRALRKRPIWSIFLMGSVSSVAFSKTSDMDIWLCHDPALSEKEIALLQKKATAIEQWANSIQLEVHFFLMNSESFRQGQEVALSSESSGKTQHYLLLEEFYRTAIYVAGKFPAWWLVPPHEENNYSTYISHLSQNKFITENDFIDFGGLDDVPLDEFISATLWHIYKAIDSPHKSLLKLLLMEVYASEYPNIQWLSLDLKKAIYDGNYKADELDPYFLIYKKIDAYLVHNRTSSRLTLARESFYLKITGFYQNKDPKKKQQLNAFIQDIAQHWNWPETLIPSISDRKIWTIQKANQEHKIMIRHLSHVYRSIKSFANKHPTESKSTTEDLRLIGNSLLAFLQKKPGKVRIMSTKGSIYTLPVELSIIETNAKSAEPEWYLYEGQISSKNKHQFEPVTIGKNLIDVLTWLCVNDLYQTKLKFHLESPSSEITASELHFTLSQIDAFLTKQLHDKKSSIDKYKKKNKLVASLILVNLTRHPQDNESIVMTQNSDPFFYGSDKTCFINTSDIISVTQWGEVIARRSKSIEGLFDQLTLHLNNHAEPITEDSFSVHCFTSAHATNIIKRIKVLYSSLVNQINDENQQYSRYFIAAGYYAYVFQRSNNYLSYRLVYSRSELLQELSNAQEQSCKPVFEPGLMDHDIIPFLYSRNLQQTIQVFYLSEQASITLYIIDENGALFIEKSHNSTADQLIARYMVFFDNIIDRYFKATVINTLFYKLETEPFRATPCMRNFTKLKNDFLSLRLSGEFNNEKPDNYSLYCDNKEFSSIIYGNGVFTATANYIFQFRQNQKNYPIHVSDINIPTSFIKSKGPEPLQTIHLLKYKQRIEQRLDQESQHFV